jgi:Asp-tRNA(Asn)/Glu-tRNA(Gln) amidotransferase C subunit
MNNEHTTVPGILIPTELSPTDQEALREADEAIYQSTELARTVLQTMIKHPEAALTEQEEVLAEQLNTILDVTNNGYNLDFTPVADPYFKNPQQQQLQDDFNKARDHTKETARRRVGLGLLSGYVECVAAFTEATLQTPPSVA